MSIDDLDVLIVGAGPVGLLLGLMLQAHGLKVQIVERQKAAYPLPRAIALDHESCRLLGSVGLSEELKPLLQTFQTTNGGDDGTNYVWRDADLKMIVDLFMETPTRSGFTSLATFNQPELEAVLNDAAITRNLPILRGYTVSALEESTNMVTAYLDAVRTKPGTTLEERDLSPSQIDTSANGHTHISMTASYVIGCDGANSTVRRLMEINNTDLNFENDWLIFDLLLRDGYIPPRVAKVGSCQVCDPRRPTSVVPGGYGRRRFEFMRLPGETKEELLDEENIWSMLGEWGFTKDNCDLERKVIYTFRARWAEVASKGRVVLAGDSLHLMPPFMGQGLNSGFRDAAALAWRLPLLLSGVGDQEALLQTYEKERIEHVKWLTIHSVKLGEVVCETDPDKSKAIHAALRAAPPPHLYNPPLGRPGILVDQAEAGELALQRPLKIHAGDAEQPLFDQVHGYGWVLLNLGDRSVDEHLSGKSRQFFAEVLKGKCVSIPASQDDHGEYRDWFTTRMAPDHVVLVRPDFYVFGHASASEVNELVQKLCSKIGAL